LPGILAILSFVFLVFWTLVRYTTGAHAKILLWCAIKEQERVVDLQVGILKRILLACIGGEFTLSRFFV
jgi:hypothetical protein